MEIRQILSFLLLFITGTDGMTSHKAMTEFCKAKIPLFVNHSIILELTNEILEDTSSKFLHCAIDIVTGPYNRLLLHFLSLDISSDNRTPDRLHIYDYNSDGGIKQMTPVMGLYGVYDSYYRHTTPGVGDYKSSRHKLRLDYQGRPTLAYSGFKLLITAFKDASDKGSCGKMYRKCSRSRMCVPLSVMCDMEYNCGEGDKSDEDKCQQLVDPGWNSAEATTMAAVTAVIAIGIFIFIIIVVVCVLVRYTKRNFIRRESFQVGLKKDANGEWSLVNNMDRAGITAMYAPPTYEDVVGVEEDPPPAYDALNVTKQSRPRRCNHNRERVTIVRIETDAGQGDIAMGTICDDMDQSNCALHTSDVDQSSVCSDVSGDYTENSSQDCDSGNFAGESSQACSSSQNSDFSSVSSGQQVENDKCPETEQLLPVGSMNELLKDSSDTLPKSCSVKTIDHRKHMCILNCDDIELAEDDEGCSTDK